MSDSLWATVWQTVAAEFSDVPDLSEGLRILLRLSLALLLGLLLVNWLQPGAGVDPVAAQAMLAQGADRAKDIVGATASQPKGLDMLLAIVPDNVVKAAAENTILAVMFFALMLVIGLVLALALTRARCCPASRPGAGQQPPARRAHCCANSPHAGRGRLSVPTLLRCGGLQCAPQTLRLPVLR